MPVKPIIIGADRPILRAKAGHAVLFDKDLRRLLRDLHDTTAHLQGAGLAAPQVGVSQAVCVAKISGELVSLVNPTILWHSEEVVMGEEGCFSLPDVWLVIPRALEIIVQYRDGKGREQERKLTHFDARVVQHEVDHLLGKLIVDYKAEAVKKSGEAL